MTTTTDVWLQVNGEQVAECIDTIRVQLENAQVPEGDVKEASVTNGVGEDGCGGEVFIDLSPVRQIDAAAVRALEALAAAAGEKQIKLVLRGINVEVYRVLKLVKLAKRYVFVP